MEAILKFDHDEEAHVEFDTWAFRRLENGSMLLEFFDEEERQVEIVELTKLRDVAFSYGD